MSGPDYTAFKNGWWELTRNFEEMRNAVYPGKNDFDVLIKVDRSSYIVFTGII